MDEKKDNNENKEQKEQIEEKEKSEKAPEESVNKEKELKTRQIVKSIKMLDGVLKTSPDPRQRARVKKDIDTLRKTLKEMYPKANIRALEEAIYTESLKSTSVRKDNFSDNEYLKNITVEIISTYKDDVEINEVASIIKYFEDRIWGIITDQHTKLDFSNSGERESLYRMLDQCDRALNVFCQTLEDIEKAKASEYLTQLQMMRSKQGRVFLFNIYDFFRSARDFVTSLVSDSDFGGTMVLNSDDKVEYDDFEKYKTFEKWKLIDALKYLKGFIDAALSVIKVPDVKRHT